VNKSTVEVRTVEVTVEYLDALRKAAGAAIDPQTAEIHWEFGQVLDPYGDRPDLPPECDCVGRQWFARAAGGVWIWEGDLPDATRHALRNVHQRTRCRSEKLNDLIDSHDLAEMTSCAS
jgi:hypothetical protein